MSAKTWRRGRRPAASELVAQRCVEQRQEAAISANVQDYHAPATEPVRRRDEVYGRRLAAEPGVDRGAIG
jgi:hypothetical protein